MKSGQYIWHTVGDDKVRPEHAARDGTIFSWTNPPEGGHPGEDPAGAAVSLPRRTPTS